MVKSHHSKWTWSALLNFTYAVLNKQILRHSDSRLNLTAKLHIVTTSTLHLLDCYENRGAGLLCCGLHFVSCPTILFFIHFYSHNVSWDDLHLCLQTLERDTNSSLAGTGLKWAVVPRIVVNCIDISINIEGAVLLTGTDSWIKEFLIQGVK